MSTEGLLFSLEVMSHMDLLKVKMMQASYHVMDNAPKHWFIDYHLAVSFPCTQVPAIPLRRCF
jgi:hypothetical protein